jgi:hypothetical protein
MTEENAFDAELNALMNGEIPASQPNPTPQATGTPVTANPSAAPKVFKAAGREWTDPAELAKSHDALSREFSKRNQDWSELKDLREVKQRLHADPEFNRYFKAALDAYQNTRNQGTPNKAPNQSVQALPEEVAKEFERVKEMANVFELERETQALVRKYKLAEDDVRKVEDYSLANNGIPLEQAYKQMMFDLNHQKIEQAKAAEQVKKKEVSRTSAVPGHYQPSPKGGPSLKSDADWRSAAGKELEKFFTSE